MDRKTPLRLDARKPLVLDTHELGRRPGSMREMNLRVPAPEGLGLSDVIGVQAGADLQLNLRLESVMEGVLVSGMATAPITGECGRCLDPVTDTLRVRLQELFVYSPTVRMSSDDQDVDEAHMSGELLDVEPTVRDAVLLALPVTPLCRWDCAGLCVQCGDRLDDLPSDHAHGATDHRWSALQDLFTTHPTQE